MLPGEKLLGEVPRRQRNQIVAPGRGQLGQYIHKICTQHIQEISGK